MSLFSNIKGDMSGALSAAIITLPMCIGYGIIVFAPLGNEFAPQAAMTGVYSAVFAGFLAAFFGGNPIQITGPKALLMFVQASLVMSLAKSPHLPGVPETRYLVVVGLASVSVLIAGLFQVVFALLRFGNLTKYVPHPVVAGFTNGIGILLIMKQINPLVGTESGKPLWGLLTGATGIQPLTLLIGLITLGSIYFSKRFVKGIPASLIALGTGSAVYYGIRGLWPSSTLGPLIGNIPFELPRPDIFLQLLLSDGIGNMRILFRDLLITGFVISLLSSMETLLSSVTSDNLTGNRHNSHRELMGQGIGNIVTSFFGSLAAAGSVPRTMANFKAGGRTPLSGMMCGIFIFLIMMILGPIVGKIPLSVIAGILISVGVSLFDKWTVNVIRKLHNPFGQQKDVMVNLFVTLLVTGVTVSVNMIVAVGIGMMAASALFVSKMGKSIIKRQYTGKQFRSKKMRSPEHRDILEKGGKLIVVFELQGPIFFGSAENLANEIEASMKNAFYCILDMKRVNEIDSTGANILLQIDKSIRKDGKYLLISYLRENRSLWEFLGVMDVVKMLGEDMFFRDTDEALEWAEDHLLEHSCQYGGTCAGIRPEDMDIVKGFTSEELADFKEKLVRRIYRKGEAVFREGDPGTDLFLLTRGAVTVKIRLPDGERFKRLFTFTPGVIFGEVALLDGNPRSADVWAEEDAELYRLSLDDFNVLRKEKPEIVIKLLFNIAKEFSRNIRRISDEVRSLEDT